MDNNLEDLKKQVKASITDMVSNGKISEASMLIDEYLKVINDDDALSIKAVILIMQEEFVTAKEVIEKGLKINQNNFDLNYNLAYIYEKLNEKNLAINQYKVSYEICSEETMRNEILKTINNISSTNIKNKYNYKLKIVFFVKQGMDNFLGDIIKGLSEHYEVKKIIVTQYNQIDEGMKEADICWFEWCDELIEYGSKHELAKSKLIICRLHRYEAFTDYIKRVEWTNVDKTIFVSEHIRDIVRNKVNIPLINCNVIYNGINLDKFRYIERKKGFNLAWIGYINLRKNIILVLQYFNELIKVDKRYQLHIAGSFQDEALLYYVEDIVTRLNLKSNIHFHGFIANDIINEWLNDKSYIVTGSIAEGHPVGVMEAMASGLKPVIHYFPGAEEFYPKEYLYYSFEDFMKIITEDKYNSKDYRDFIECNYALSNQIEKIQGLINLLCDNQKIGLSIEEIKSKVIEDKINSLEANFNIDSDNIENTEALFDYLLQIGDEERYMRYLSEWFVRSRYDLTSRFNYYYSNMYRKLNGYTRFKYIDEMAYIEMERIGMKFYQSFKSMYFNSRKTYINNENQKVLFVLNGLDIEQSVTQFFINYIEQGVNTNFKYSVLSLLNENEFSNSKKSIDYFRTLNIDLLIPHSNTIEEKVKEFYKFIGTCNFDYVIYQSLYYAPIGVLLYPLFEGRCKLIGKIQFQQPEPYFDKKVDFVYTYIKKDNCSKNIFDPICPINTDIIDKNLNIKELLDIENNKKVIISIGRAIKYKNHEFWNFVIKLVTNIDDTCFVVFGCKYDDYKEYVPDKLVKEKKIYFAGFNLNASAYLKSCNFYLNSYPGGGFSLEEAYYAKLPIITFYEEENNNNQYDAMIISYMITAYLYNDAENIFPKTGDFEGLFEFAKKLIEDINFRSYVEKHRAIIPDNLKFSNFVEELEKYIKNFIKSN